MSIIEKDKEYLAGTYARFPLELTEAIKEAGDDRNKIYTIGTEWCTMQCKDLISHGVPAVHFYTMGKSENIVRILKECF